MATIHRVMGSMALLLSTGWVLSASDVVITPERKTLAAGSGTVRFSAAYIRWDPSDQPAWHWTVEAFTGGKPAVHGGTITQAGEYQPPASILHTRIYRIRATADHDPSITGTALVRIHPRIGVAALHATLKQFGASVDAGERIEHLAGSASEAEARVDSGVGATARFVEALDLVAAPQVPWKVRGRNVTDAWLVTEGGGGVPAGARTPTAAVRLMTADGGVETLATVDRLEGSNEGIHFNRTAVRPWKGPGDGEWEAFFWDRDNAGLWRLGADRKLAPYAGLPGMAEGKGEGQSGTGISRCQGLAVDAGGTVYVAETWESKVHPGQWRSSIRVVRPEDRQFRVLVGDPVQESAKDQILPIKLGLINGLTLDPGTGLLYTLEKTTPHDVAQAGLRQFQPKRVVELFESLKAAKGKLHDRYYVRLITIDPRDGKVGRAPHWKDDPVCLAGPWGTELAFHQGRVVVSDTYTRRVFLVDARTWQPREIHQEHGAAGEALAPGPCRPVAVEGEAPTAGTLGKDFRRLAVDAEGRIAVLSGEQVGLLLLDWERLGLSHGTPAGAAGGEKRQESKGESKGGL